MIEYNKLFSLLKMRNMKKTDLLKVISPQTLAKLSKNAVVTTETIDKICTFLHVQPDSIMEVYKYEELNGEQRKVKYTDPAEGEIFQNEIKRLVQSELKRYVNEEGFIDMEKLKNDQEKIT